MNASEDDVLPYEEGFVTAETRCVVVNTAAVILVVGAGTGDVIVPAVVAEALVVDAAEVVPLADTGKQHASNVTYSPSQHAVSPDG